MTQDQYDEIDRLFSRLDPVELPTNFVQTVMARATAEHAPARRTMHLGWIMLDVAAALVLAIAGFDVGQTLAIGSISALMDPDMISLAPSEWLLAVGDSLPLLSLALAGFAAFAVVLTTRGLLRRVDVA